MNMMRSGKTKPGSIIIRSIVIAGAIALVIGFCLSLRYENMRTSEVFGIEGRSEYVGQGDEVVQDITIDEGEDTLYGIAILFDSQYINPEGDVTVAMYKDGKQFCRWVRKGQFLQNTNCEYFRFDKAEKTQGHEYQFRITFEGFGGYKPFSFHKGVSAKNEPCTINGRSIGSPIFHLLIYDALPVWKIVLIPVIVFLSLIVWQAIYFLFLKPRFKLGQDHDFASLYIILLILYFIFVPLNSVFDEANHFLRSYSVAHGKFISDVTSIDRLGGDVLPSAVCDYAEMYKYNADHNGHRLNDEPLKALHADWNDTREIVFPNTAINTPVMYLPQAAGIKVTELFSDRPFDMAYGGRFVNMAVTAVLVILAVFITPAGKNYFKFTALLPIMMQESVSLAPDGFITAVIMVYAALILRARYKCKKVLDIRYVILLFVLTIVVITSKLVYAPLCLLLFLIPKEKFGGKSRYYTAVGVFALSIIIFAMSWFMIIQRYNLRFQHSNSGMQMDYILSEPLQAFSIFSNYILDAGRYLTQMFGERLGNDNIPLFAFTGIMLAAIAALYCYKQTKGSEKGKRAIPVIIVIIVYLFVGAAEYLGWTKVGAPSVFGVSGRYLLPIVPVMMFAVSGVSQDEGYSLSFREKTAFATALINLFAIVSIWIYTVY